MSSSVHDRDGAYRERRARETVRPCSSGVVAGEVTVQWKRSSMQKQGAKEEMPPKVHRMSRIHADGVHGWRSAGVRAVVVLVLLSSPSSTLRPNLQVRNHTLLLLPLELLLLLLLPLQP